MRPWSAKADSLTWNCREAKRVRVCSNSADFRIDQLQEGKCQPDWVIASDAEIWSHRKCDEAGALSCLPVSQRRR